MLALADREIPELGATVRGLLERFSMGESVARQFDRFWYVLVLLASRHRLIDQVSWRFFVIHPDDVFGTNALRDIGADVRNVLTNAPGRRREYMCDLVEYAIPYIKHNRLVFPPLDAMTDGVVRDLVRIMMATCLGVYPHARRTPLWSTRLQILWEAHSMLHTNDVSAMHAFCEAQQPLMRISFIEYFVFFTRTNMPAELETMRAAYESRDTIDVIYDNLAFVFDSFRQTALADSLDWSRLGDACGAAMERCSRVHKGRASAQTFRERRRAPRTRFSDDEVRLALRLPRFRSIFYAMHMGGCYSAIAPGVLERVMAVHNIVVVYRLPTNITREQCAVFSDFVRDKGITSMFPIMQYVCVRCRSARSQARMRLSSSGVVCCDECRSSDFVLPVNSIGRLVRVEGTLYYMCSFCLNLHVWKSTGTEFTRCEFSCAPAPPPRPLACRLCARAHVECFRVLDDRLGVFASIPLCRFHTPFEQAHSTIHNIDALNAAIRFKVDSKRGAAARHLPKD